MMRPSRLLPGSSGPTTPSDGEVTRAVRVADRLARVVLESALALCPSADAAALYAVCSEGSRLSPCTQTHRGDDRCRWQDLLIEGEVAGAAFARGTPLVVDDGRLVSEVASVDGGALLVAALAAQDAPGGLIALWSPSPALGAHDGALEALIPLAGLALQQTTADAVREGEAARAPALPDSVLEGLLQGVAVVDAGRTIRQMNRALRQVLGLAPDAPRLPCFLDGEGCPEPLHRLLDPSGAPIVGPYIVTVERPDGRCCSLEVLPSPLDERGTLAYVVLDVSEERAASEGRSAFISQIAHELRAPIQHIMGFASIISDVSDLSEETLHRFLGHINEESRRLARLVDDLAELSRIEIGRFSINRQQVRVDTLLRELVARHTPSATSKDLTLSLEMPGEPVSEETDPARLEQVIGNLVENAVKFVPAGGRIDLSMDACDDWLTIRVADTGPGIPPASVARIFDRFYQVPQADGQLHKGMGLGLYISREIVRGLGGDISVETRTGHGCAFAVRLPRH